MRIKNSKNEGGVRARLKLHVVGVGKLWTFLCYQNGGDLKFDGEQKGGLGFCLKREYWNFLRRRDIFLQLFSVDNFVDYEYCGVGNSRKQKSHHFMRANKNQVQVYVFGVLRLIPRVIAKKTMYFKIQSRYTLGNI